VGVVDLILAGWEEERVRHRGRGTLNERGERTRRFVRQYGL